MIVVDELLVLIKMNFICWVLNMLEDMILWLIKCVLMVYLFFLDFSVNGIDGLMLMDIDQFFVDDVDKSLIEKFFSVENVLGIWVEFILELLFLEIENMEFFLFLLFSLCLDVLKFEFLDQKLEILIGSFK